MGLIFYFFVLLCRTRLILSGWCGSPPSELTSCSPSLATCCSQRSAPCWLHRCFSWLTDSFMNWLIGCRKDNNVVKDVKGSALMSRAQTQSLCEMRWKERSLWILCDIWKALCHDLFLLRCTAVAFYIISWTAADEWDQVEGKWRRGRMKETINCSIFSTIRQHCTTFQWSLMVKVYP